MRRSLAVLAMVPVLMANQCYPAFDVRVAPGPQPLRPVITGEREGQPVELNSVAVSRCRPGDLYHPMWSVEVATDSLVYGAPPHGTDGSKAAEPLALGGCYNISAWGRLRSNQRAMGHGGFRLLPDGTVVNGTGAQGRRLEREREVDRMAVACRRAYRRARTETDSAGVDARAWAVSDTTITCGWLRTRDPDTIATTESTERLLLQAAAGVAAIAALSVLQNALKARGP